MARSNFLLYSLCVHEIRPYKLFSAFTAALAARCITAPIPSRRGFGGISLLEAFLLITSCKLVDARKLFEFGTFLGSTTFILALNSAPDARILTLDLDRNTPLSIPQHEADAPLTDIRLDAKGELDFAGSSVAHKITTLTGDSVRYDFSEYRRQMDWIFIDGGHDLVSVRSDTENAFRMINVEKLSCIAWHDYRSPDADYSDLTRYLDDLSQQKTIFHVADTKLCFWFNDPDRRIIPGLLE